LAADANFIYLTAYLSESKTLLVKLPLDGSKTGTYVVGGVTFQITANSQTWIDTSRTYASNSPTIADSSGTVTTATLTDEVFAPTYSVLNF
jgi:hypothetical protein